MLCRHPFESIEFEVPDAWLIAAGALGFVAQRSSFAALSELEWPTVLVPVEEVQPPRRNAGVTGFHQQRAISVLKAMVANEPLPAIEVHRMPFAHNCLSVRDGYHRYFLSLALGFNMLPVSVRPYFDINAL